MTGKNREELLETLKVTLIEALEMNKTKPLLLLNPIILKSFLKYEEKDIF